MITTVDWLDCHIWTNDVDTVIARDANDAVAVWHKHTGEDWSDYGDMEMWTQIEDDKEITVFYDILDLELTPVPGSATRTDDKLRAHFTATCKAWVRCFGRSFLCSTEY